MKVNEEEFFNKAVKHKNIPKNDALKQILLKRIMQDFDKGEKYSEEDVKQVIIKYFEDFTLIRRELVNFGYMRRDSLKGEYWVVKKELSKEDYLKIGRLKLHAQELGILD